jgi:hypothetical protein
MREVLRPPIALKRLNGVTVAKKNSVCYLGLLLDKNFNFIDHMKQVGEKAKKNFYALTRDNPH